MPSSAITRSIPSGRELSAYPEIYVDDWLFLKEIPLDHAGEYVEQHVHAYDHVTFLVQGEVDVEVDSDVRRYTARRAIPIKAGTMHKITAVVDDTLLFCIHNLRGEDEPAVIP